MDEVSKRYSHPYFFMDGMIETGRFSEFVTTFTNVINEEKEDDASWQIFLHKVWGKSYKEFKDELKTDKENRTMPKEKMEAIVKESMDILKDFTPKEER